jgi:hypothetical protein
MYGPKDFEAIAEPFYVSNKQEVVDQDLVNMFEATTSKYEHPVAFTIAGALRVLIASCISLKLGSECNS